LKMDHFCPWYVVHCNLLHSAYVVLLESTIFRIQRTS
jgi:hypothetical protein